MEITNYIKNKKKIGTALQTISKIKKWLLIQGKETDIWYIFDNGELLFKIGINISGDLIALKITSPLIFEIETAAEIYLRQLFMDCDFRHLFGKISLDKKDDMIYLMKKISFKSKQVRLELYLLDQLNETLNHFEQISHVAESRIGIISQIKQN